MAAVALTGRVMWAYLGDGDGAVRELTTALRKPAGWVGSCCVASTRRTGGSNGR